MKCPSCGFWNKASFPKCFRCGAPLTAAEDIPAAQASASATDVELDMHIPPIEAQPVVAQQQDTTPTHAEIAAAEADADPVDADPRTELQRTVQRMLSNNRNAYRVNEEPPVTTERRDGAQPAQDDETPQTPEPEQRQSSAQQHPPLTVQTAPTDDDTEPITAHIVPANVPVNDGTPVPTANAERVSAPPAADNAPTPRRSSMSFIPPSGDSAKVYVPRAQQARQQAPSIQGSQPASADDNVTVYIPHPQVPAPPTDDDNVTVYMPRTAQQQQQQTPFQPVQQRAQRSPPISHASSPQGDDAVTQYVPRRRRDNPLVGNDAQKDAPAYVPTRKASAQPSEEHIPAPMRKMRSFSDEERERYIQSTRREPSWRPPPSAPDVQRVTHRQVAPYRDAENTLRGDSRDNRRRYDGGQVPALTMKRKDPGMYMGARSGRMLKTGITLIIWLIILGGLAYGAYQGIQWVGEKTGFLKASGDSVTDENQAIVLTQEINGKPGHVITFAGTDDQQIFIKQLKNTYEFISGVATVLVADDIWITPDTETDTVEVELTPTLYSESNAAMELAPIKYTVTVPLSPITLITPDKERTDANSSQYTLKIKVVPGSKVMIQDADVSDFVDREGIISHLLKIEPIGDNAFIISVKTEGHRTNRQTIYIFRPKMDIDLEIDNNIPDHSTSKTMTITGQTDPSATITVDTPIKEKDIKPSADGKFSFTAVFSFYGENEVRIRASIPGKQDSVISHYVEYTPGVDEYVNGSWVMDYAGILGNSTGWKGRAFKCQGTVTQMLNDDPCTFHMDVGGGKIVLIEMWKGKSVVEGKKYRVYADVDSIVDGIPKLIGRYVYGPD